MSDEGINTTLKKLVIDPPSSNQSEAGNYQDARAERPGVDKAKGGSLDGSYQAEYQPQVNEEACNDSEGRLAQPDKHSTGPRAARCTFLLYCRKP